MRMCKNSASRVDNVASAYSYLRTRERTIIEREWGCSLSEDVTWQSESMGHPVSYPLSVVLVEPEIPPNTGNTARLCAATHTPLHLVGKLGFRTDDKAVRRAGLDYWKEVEIRYHIDMEAVWSTLPKSRFLYFTTKSERLYTDFQYAPGDALVFGRETCGLPEDLLRANWERCLTIPM